MGVGGVDRSRQVQFLHFIFLDNYLPCQQDEGLVVVEEVLEPNLVVHYRLQTFYTLVMNFIPLSCAGKKNTVNAVTSK